MNAASVRMRKLLVWYKGKVAGWGLHERGCGVNAEFTTGVEGKGRRQKRVVKDQLLHLTENRVRRYVAAEALPHHLESSESSPGRSENH